MGSVDRGAPIDVKWLNDLNDKVEKLISAVNSSPYQQASINNPVFDQSSGMRVMKTSETRIHAETSLIPSSTYEAGTTTAFSVSLTNYASPPVATANPIAINTPSAKPIISAVVTSVTRSSVNGYLYFHNKVESSVTVGVSVLAIGVPSNSTGTASTNIQTNKFYNSPPIM